MLRAVCSEVKARKVVVEVELRAGEKLTARGTVVCVEAPAELFENS